jgi:hypothetical protein
MTQLLDRARPKRKFFQIDVLSRFGETICLPPIETSTPQREQPRPPAVIENRAWEEDPERWDGLS